MPAPAHSFSTVTDSPERVARELSLTLGRVGRASGALVFVSGRLAEGAGAVADAVAPVLGGVPALVVSGAAVLNEDGELENQSAASGLVWAGGRPEVLVGSGGVLSHALALDYSSGFLHSDSSLLGLEALPLYWNLLRLQVPWIVVPFALLGVIVLLRRDPKASALLLLTYGFTLLAALRFLASVGEDGDHFIPPYLLMGIWFAVGADAVIAWSQARLRWSRYVLAVLLWALVLANLWVQYPRALDRQQVTLRADSEALLSRPRPAGSGGR